MKKFLLLLVFISVFSCSSDDDCDSKRNEINSHYDEMVEIVMNNPLPNGQIDWRQIGLLNDERDLRLQNACR